MNANYDEQLLLAYVEGELDNAGQKQVEAWMLEDPELDAMLKGMMSDREIMMDISEEEAPAWILDDITRSMERDMLLDGLPTGQPVEQHQEEAVPVLARIGMPLGAVAATLVIGVVAASLYFSGVISFGPGVQQPGGGDEMAVNEGEGRVADPHEDKPGLVENPSNIEDEVDRFAERTDTDHSLRGSVVRDDSRTSDATRGGAPTMTRTAIDRAARGSSGGAITEASLTEISRSNDADIPKPDLSDVAGREMVASLSHNNGQTIQLAQRAFGNRQELQQEKSLVVNAHQVASLNINAKDLEQTNALVSTYAVDNKISQLNSRVYYPEEVTVPSSKSSKPGKGSDLLAKAEGIAKKKVEDSDLASSGTETLSRSVDAEAEYKEKGRGKLPTPTLSANEAKKGESEDRNYSKNRESKYNFSRRQVITLVVPEREAQRVLRELDDQLRSQNQIAPEATNERLDEKEERLRQAAKDLLDDGEGQQEEEKLTQDGLALTDNDGGRNNKPSAPMDQMAEGQEGEQVKRQKQQNALGGQGGETSDPKLEPESEVTRRPQSLPTTNQPGHIVRLEPEEDQTVEPSVVAPAQQGQQGQGLQQSRFQGQAQVMQWEPDEQNSSVDQQRQQIQTEFWGIPSDRLEQIFKSKRLWGDKQHEKMVTIQVIIEEK